jgi:hypothetical protein
MTSTFSRINAPGMHWGAGVLFAGAFGSRSVLLVS